MEIANLKQITLAILLSQNKALSVDELHNAFAPEDKVSREVLKKVLYQLLKEDFDLYNVVRHGGEYRIQLKSEFNNYIKRINGEPIESLPRALLETLAIIAYKQPVTRADIFYIRGVETHIGVFQQLEERGWIKVIGHGGESGRAHLYATTKTFLQYFGLGSIQELPNLPIISNLQISDSDIENIPEKAVVNE